MRDKEADVRESRVSSKVSWGVTSGAGSAVASHLPMMMCSDERVKLAALLEVEQWQAMSSARQPKEIVIIARDVHLMMAAEKETKNKLENCVITMHEDDENGVIGDDDPSPNVEKVEEESVEEDQPDDEVLRTQGLVATLINGSPLFRSRAASVGATLSEEMIDRSMMPRLGYEKFDKQLKVWSGGNMKGAGALPLPSDKIDELLSRERSLHHTRIDDVHDKRFLPRTMIMSRTIHTIIMLSISDEPVEWLSNTITSIADTVREIVASVSKPLPWESIVLVLECANDAPSETLWLLETLGLLRPKCFDVLPSASCHVFEITLDTAKFCSVPCNRIDPNGPVPSPRSCPLQVALVVRCTPTAPIAIALFPNRLDHLQYVLRVPPGGIIQIGALSALINALDNDPFVDAALGVMSPVSIISVLSSSPCVASEAHHWVSSALLADQTSSGCDIFYPPPSSSLSLSRATPSSSWRTLIVMEARLETNLPKSALLVLDSARNDKARQWINLMGQWRRSRLRDLPRLAILTTEALLWFFNISLVWAFITFTTTFGATGTITITGLRTFQLIMTFTFVTQMPLLMWRMCPVPRSVIFIVSLWSMPAMFIIGVFEYLTNSNHLVQSQMRIYHGGTIVLESADIIALVGFAFSIVIVLIVAFLNSRFTFMILSLPFDLAVFPGRFISAVPNSIGNLKDTQTRAAFATAWITFNVAAAFAITHVPLIYLSVIIAFASLSLTVIRTYQLCASVVNTVRGQNRPQPAVRPPPLRSIATSAIDSKILKRNNTVVKKQDKSLPEDISIAAAQHL